MQQNDKNIIGEYKISIPNKILIPQIVRQINEGHTVTLPLRGFSMRPFLQDGRDKALLTRVTTPQTGVPVLAEITPNRYVLHRIVKVDGSNVTLLGDGNVVPEQCQIKDIRASVIGFYRKGHTTLDRIDGRKWKIYSFIWMTLRPIRRWLLAACRLAGI